MARAVSGSKSTTHRHGELRAQTSIASVAAGLLALLLYPLLVALAHLFGALRGPPLPLFVILEAAGVLRARELAGVARGVGGTACRRSRPHADVDANCLGQRARAIRVHVALSIARRRWRRRR